MFLASLLAALPVGQAFAAEAPAPEKDWTILVYLNADNNLDGFGVGDINEMEKVGSSDKVNVVVQLDRLGEEGTWRYLVQKDTDEENVTSPIVDTLAEQDMGAADTFKSFIQWGMEKYPAKHYMVDIWNHGSGWELAPGQQPVFKGCSYDDSSGNHLSVNQVGQVLREVVAARGGQKIDVMGYDCCLMQMAECAGEVADSCLFQVASEETEPGDGWAYDDWLSKVVANPEMDGAGVGKALVETYTASYNGGSQGDSGSTLSLIDLSKLGAVSTAADAFSQAVLAEQADRPKVVEAIDAAQSYAESSHHDMADFVDQITSRITAKPVQDTGAALKAALGGLILANGANSEGLARSSGLSVWIPTYASQGLMDQYKTLKWSANGKWSEFVSALTANGQNIYTRQQARVANFNALHAAR